MAFLFAGAGRAAAGPHAAGFVALAVTSSHAGGYPAGILCLYLLGLGLGQVSAIVFLLSALRCHSTIVPANGVSRDEEPTSTR